MQTIRLGRTDLDVSRICFDTWQFGGDWGEVDRDEALAASRRARELNINFFDTAQGYGFGRSEELLARGLGSELRTNRNDVVIATKGGLRPVDGGVEGTAGAGSIALTRDDLEAIEAVMKGATALGGPSPAVV